MNRTLFLISILSFSISWDTYATVKESPKKVIKKVIQKMKSYKTIKLSAKYSLVNKNENISHDLTSELKLEGNKYKLDFMGMERISDGKNVYTIDPESEEVTISKLKDKNRDDETIISPTELLTFFEKGFDYEWAKTDGMNSNSLFVIRLVATRNTDFKDKKMFLGINKRTLHPQKVFVQSNDGTVIKVVITSFLYNVPIPRKTFKFDETQYSSYFISKE